jgi:hypothetical protein
VGTTNACPTFSPASRGRVQSLLTASRAEFACREHMPGKPIIVCTPQGARLCGHPPERVTMTMTTTSPSCPSWCHRRPGQRFEHGTDPEDVLEEITGPEHTRGVGGLLLDEIRNQVSGAVLRPGQGSVELTVRRADRSDGGCGLPVVEVTHLSAGGPGGYDTVALTTGEARSLAAALVRAADLVEAEL